MLDNSCVTKANFDGMVNEDYKVKPLTGSLKNPVGKVVDKITASNLNRDKLLSVLTPIITACHDAAKGVSNAKQKSDMMRMVKETFAKIASEIVVPEETDETAPMQGATKAAMMKMKKMKNMKKMKKMNKMKKK